MVRCSNCIYITMTPGSRLIKYRCSYWGLETTMTLPSSVVKGSIGQDCPFYVKKTSNKASNNENNSDSGIII